MNYQKHYDRLIETRKNRVPEEGVYYERHHILMRSMGGTDDPENLVMLTAREHFLAHWLLWRIHRNRQTIYAFWSMCNGIKRAHKKPSSRAYNEAREAASKQRTIDQSGKKRKPFRVIWTEERKLAHKKRMRSLHSSEKGKAAITKREQTKRERGSNLDSRNSQYGKFWITDGVNNAKTSTIIPIGWTRGRTISAETREKMSISHLGKTHKQIS